MSGTVYLGGGGSETQEANLWNEAFRPGSTIAIWPFAHQELRERQASIAWMTSALSARGAFVIDAWMATSSGSLAGVDVVAVPGGNTFDLLQQITTTGLLNLLHQHVRTGGSLYGGSAGAILAGRDIGIASALDRNDCGCEDTRGLDLIGGLDVLPHYTEDHRLSAQEFAKGTGRALLGLPEASGVVVANAEARNVGPEPVDVVSPTSIRRIAPGETWQLGHTA